MQNFHNEQQIFLRLKLKMIFLERGSKLIQNQIYQNVLLYKKEGN